VKKDSEMLKKSVMVGVGNVIGQGIAFAFMTLLAVWMSKEEYGKVRYILSLSTVLSTFVASGFPTAMTRFLAKYHDDLPRKYAYFTNIMFIFLISLIITEIFTSIVFMGEWLLLMVILGYSVSLIYMGTVRGLMDYMKYSIFNIIRNLVKITLLLIIYLYFSITSAPVLLIYAFGGWITIFILEFLWKSDVNFNIKMVSKKLIKDVLLFSSPIFVTTIAYVTVMQAPVLILKYFSDYSEVATLSLAFTLSIVFSFIPVAISTVTMPKIASLRGNEHRIRIFKYSTALILLSGVGLIIPAILFGKQGITMVFKEEYADAYLPFIIISIGAVLAGIRNSFSALWEGGGRPIISTYDTVSAAVVTIFSSIILIPKYGVIGASISYVLGWASSILISSYFLLMLFRKRLSLS